MSRFNLPHAAYTAAWVFWIVWFGVWEAMAMFDKGENETLSGHVKTLMWNKEGGPTLVAFFVLPLLVWLCYHFYQEVRTHWTT